MRNLESSDEWRESSSKGNGSGNEAKRRAFLGVAGAGLLTVLGGCSGVRSGGQQTEQGSSEYEHYRDVALYPGPSFERTRLPETATISDDPGDAGLVVLDEETTLDGEQVVEWLRDGTPVGVVGTPAEERLFDLLEAGNYKQHFGGYMLSDEKDYDVAAVAPSGNGRLGTLYSDGSGENPEIRALDDVLGGLTQP